MLDGLYCEFLKLKRTKFYILVSLISLLCIFFSTLNKKYVAQLNWYGYFSNFEFIAFSIFYAFVIPNVVSYMFVREYQNKTACIEFSYPMGRFGSFINKFIMSVLVIACIYITGFVLVILSGFIFMKTPLTMTIIVDNLKVFAVSFVFQIALVPICGFIASISKNMIVPFIYSCAVIAGNANYLMGVKYKEYIFSILPAAVIAKLGTTVCPVPIPIKLVINSFDIYLGLTVFISGFIVCILYYRKANIY
ncbi:ABC transporter permease [Haloimpatiens sp. FM7315]|uniref:ABC transporter permease n=1 Tax=Haloimpatiens sp. FM7315 TaxID=3298609 RepID=UPI0035A29E5E